MVRTWCQTVLEFSVPDSDLEPSPNHSRRRHSAGLYQLLILAPSIFRIFSHLLLASPTSIVLVVVSSLALPLLSYLSSGPPR